MPSKHQRGSDDSEYKSDAHRMLQTKPKRLLLSIKPMDEERAREWVGACNDLDVETEITEHFVKQVREVGE